MNRYRNVLVLAILLSITCNLILFFRSMPRRYPRDDLPCNMETKPRKHQNPKQKSCPTTFVTQYFQIPSKHSHSEYIKWIHNLHGTELCLLVFTDSPQLWDSQRHAIIETSICSEGAALNRSQCFWRDQWHKDPESFIHQSYYLYISWNLKPYFLSEAVRIDCFSSQYFFWIDAGYAREPIHFNFSTQVPVIAKKSQMLFFMVDEFSKAELSKDWFHYTVMQDRLAGNLFGGHTTAITAWTSVYYHVLQEYISRSWFVGKDQNLMNTLCTKFPAFCTVVEVETNWWENPWLVTYECLTSSRRCFLKNLPPKDDPFYKWDAETIAATKDATAQVS
jgi:hypothetical protein